MFEKLPLMNVSTMMAKHAEARQALSSTNMANLNTPGYTPRDLRPFAEIVEASRLQNLGFNSANLEFSDYQVNSASENKNGNTVSLEDELFRSVEIKRQHDRALAVYQFSTDLIRLSIGRA